MTIKELYFILCKSLAHTGEAEAEAGAILAYVLGGDMSSLHLRFLNACKEDDIKKDDMQKIEEILKKRLTGMPLAYATNSRCFYGYEFFVDNRVLIPRWDSECVAECAINLATQRGYKTALDMCCGSGCLGTALLLESGLESMVFADISQAALDVAKQNAESLLKENKVLKNTEFTISDLFGKIDGVFDLIICNPPYVSREEHKVLDEQVRLYEPENALVAEDNGYALYEIIAREAGKYIKQGGVLVLEIGNTQQERIIEMLRKNNFKNINCGNDLANRPRYIQADWL